LSNLLFGKIFGVHKFYKRPN